MSSPSPTASQPRRGPQGPRGLAAALAPLTRPAFRRRGFVQGDVVTRWATIVGAELAERCCPEKLSFPAGASGGATLRVRVSGGFALELQHLAPMVIERVNTFFGYRAVARLKLVQGPLPRKKPPSGRRIRSLDAGEEAALTEGLRALADDGLRQALASLGRGIRGAQP